ncbi:hypothetical protein D3C71_977320 [compost metagenome]
MRYIRKADLERACRAMHGNPTNQPNISKTGSVRGMCERFGWVAANCVRIGAFIYHLPPVAMERLRAVPGLIRGN